MKHARTKDERYILCLYDEAVRSGDNYFATSRYEIGKAAGLHERAVDNICNLLAQANFIKKQGKTEISLTDNGLALVDRLLSEV